MTRSVKPRVTGCTNDRAHDGGTMTYITMIMTFFKTILGSRLARLPYGSPG